MARQTSIEAYHAVMDSGYVNKRHKQLYSIIWHGGPMSANSASMTLKEKLKGKEPFNVDNYNTRARLGEMREAGILCEVGTGIDPYSGKEVIFWDVTDRYPNPIPKKTKLIELVTQLMTELSSVKAEVHQLRAIINKPGQGHFFQ